MTNEEVNKIIRQQDLQGAQKMFEMVGQGGTQAQPGSYGQQMPHGSNSIINIANFANPQRKRPMSYEFLGQPFRSAYLGR